jgi:hypothetical protein
LAPTKAILAYKHIYQPSYTINLFPLPNPFLGDLSGALDRLTSTMSGQWNLMAQAPPALMGPACTGPWRVTLQP